MPKTNKKKPVRKIEPTFYGTAAVGTKGQIVIPKEARTQLGIKTGDKVIIFGNQEGVLAVVKADQLTDLLKKFEPTL